MTYTKQIILCLTILLLFPGIQLWAENYALEFDGTDDFLKVEDSSDLRGMAALTVCCWVTSIHVQFTAIYNRL